MYRFQDFLKEIRSETNLTQSELAEVLGVSKVLISMVETGQKMASKNLLDKLAKKLHVHPGVLAPFAFPDNFGDLEKMSTLERQLLEVGMKLQKQLVKEKSKNLIK